MAYFRVGGGLVSRIHRSLGPFSGFVILSALGSALLTSFLTSNPLFMDNRPLILAYLFFLWLVGFGPSFLKVFSSPARANKPKGKTQ
jgi:hypothetical protein